MESSEYLLKSSKEYFIYVCRSRAIPFVGDGLKHGQMIALWVLRDRSEKLRTLALSGLMAYQKLYVHGDVSANDLIGMLAAPYKNNIPLIDGIGHFGSKVAPDAIGAPRYTDVKRSKAAEMLLYRDLDIIPLQDNYDGSNKQPRHFLPLIPIVLLNGISGIAVGWSTNILPREPKSLIEATKLALLNKQLKPLIPYYHNYDVNVESLGNNKWEFTGKIKVHSQTSIQITELPPGLNIESFRKRLIEMENNEQISSFVDRSTENIDITIRLKRKRDENGEIYIDNTILTEKEAIELFKLRERVTERIVVIDWNEQNILTYDNPEQLIKDFVKWRLSWYTKRYQFYHIRDNYELNYWKALKILFEYDFPNRLGTFDNKLELQKDIISTIDNDVILDDDQMDKIINLPTYRWTKEFINDINKKIESLTQSISEYTSILETPDKLRDIYLKELDELKKLT
jgi:DNA gyrase/topoisomerase IV subunit A